jgi:hypothetical protein
MSGWPLAIQPPGYTFPLLQGQVSQATSPLPPSPVGAHCQKNFHHAIGQIWVYIRPQLRADGDTGSALHFVKLTRSNKQTAVCMTVAHTCLSFISYLYYNKPRLVCALFLMLPWTYVLYFLYYTEPILISALFPRPQCTYTFTVCPPFISNTIIDIYSHVLYFLEYNAPILACAFFLYHNKPSLLRHLFPILQYDEPKVVVLYFLCYT